MTKYLTMTDNGFVWAVPASVVADNRAKYYAERDKDTTYQEEFDFLMGDEGELCDWFMNNMNFENLHPHVKLIKKPETPDEPDMADVDLDFTEIDGEYLSVA